MKKAIFALLFCTISSYGITAKIPFHTDYLVHAEKETPPYAKWGTLPVQKTADKYPNANVVNRIYTLAEKIRRTQPLRNSSYG